MNSFLITDPIEIENIHEYFELTRIPTYRHDLYGGVLYVQYQDYAFPELGEYVRIKLIAQTERVKDEYLQLVICVPEVFRILVYPFYSAWVIECHVIDNATATQVVKKLAGLKI